MKIAGGRSGSRRIADIAPDRPLQSEPARLSQILENVAGRRIGAGPLVEGRVSIVPCHCLRPGARIARGAHRLVGPRRLPATRSVTLSSKSLCREGLLGDPTCENMYFLVSDDGENPKFVTKRGSSQLLAAAAGHRPACDLTAGRAPCSAR